MFKRKNRVPGNTRFRNAYLFSTPLFEIKIKKNKLPFNRFAVVVAKKIDKRATVRNKIKRLVRSILQELYGSMITGLDLIFIGKKNILKTTSVQIKKNMENLLKKEGFLK